MGTNIRKRQTYRTNRTPKKLLDTLHFGPAGTTKMTVEAKIFWWPNVNKDIEDKVKNCIACLASGENLNYQILKNGSGKLERLQNRDMKSKSIS